MAKSKKSKKKINAEKANYLTFLAGVALGLVIVFAIIIVNVVVKMGIISFNDDNTETPSEFVEVTEEEDEIFIEQLEELRGLNDLSSILKGWANQSSPLVASKMATPS